MTDQPPKRGRGRPPGSTNKPKVGRPKIPKGVKIKSARVEARKKALAAKQAARAQAEELGKAAKAERKAAKAAAKAAQVDFAEIVPPGEEFGTRPQRDPGEEAEQSILPRQYQLMFPRPRGRPRGCTLLKCDEETLRRIWNQGVVQNSREHLAVALGVSIDTIQRFFDEHPIAWETFEDARTAGVGALRAHHYREAMTGNTTILMQASKHYLGMKDSQKDAADPATKLKEALSEFGAAISEKYLAFVDKEEAS